MWGIIAGTTLLSIYFLILTVANSFTHAVEQFKLMWYWITLLVVGFGIQAGLYTYIRGVLKLRKQSGVATSTVAAAGGISTTSMVACCAHHVTDVLPILGASAAVLFLSQFQNIFMMIGVLSNVIGINLMLKIIQKNELYEKNGSILPALMKLDMKKTLYFVSSFSVVTFLITLYINI
jgi:hypothetical protein